MTTTWNDIKCGVRQLCKAPGSTAVIVLTLALGIGVNTAIVGFIDRVFWRPLAVDRPHDLVMVRYRRDNGSMDESFIHPVYTGLRDQSQVFTGLTAYSPIMADVSTGGGLPRQVLGLAVSGNYFSLLAVRPVLGRGFLAEEDAVPGGQPVALISHAFWRQQFNSDPAVLGRTLQVKNASLTIVGVAPAEFTGTYAGMGPSVYVPLTQWATMSGISLDKYEYDWLNLLGRLRPGIGPDQAQASLSVLARQIHAAEPMNTPTEIVLADGSRGTNLWGEEDLWWPFALLQAMAALILLIACANVTSLLLARGTTRQKEMAIRSAVGATRWDVTRQLLVESMLVAIASGACGVLLAQWASHLLRSSLRIASVANIPVELDGRILVLALGVSLATAMACGLAPTLRASRPNLLSALNDGAGRVLMLTRPWGLRNLLVVAQVAVTMVVIAVGGLCMRSLAKLRVVNPGFEVEGLVAVSVDADRGPADNAEVHRLLTDLQGRIAAFPGVAAVSLASRVPLSEGGRDKTTAQRIENFTMPAGQAWISWEHATVGPGCFQTLGIPIVRGRDFSAQDRPGAARVMIVNEVAARQYWPDRDPIGQHVTFDADEVREVVGVVKAVRLRSIREEPVALSFFPLDQPLEFKAVRPELRRNWGPRPVLLARVTGDSRAMISFVQGEMQSAGLKLGSYDARALSDRVSDLLTPQRMIGSVLNVFGLVGLLFASTGVFAVVAYEVGQRTREIGIRMALGAQWCDMLKAVLRRGAILTMVGLALGLAVSVVPMGLLEAFIPELRRTDQYFLYGVHTWDPLTYLGTAGLVMAAALAACWIPARRAARIDPMEALRCE